MMLLQTIIIVMVLQTCTASDNSNMQIFYEGEHVTITFDVTLKGSSTFQMFLNGETICINDTLSPTTLSESQLTRFRPHILPNPDGTNQVHLDIAKVESDDSGIYTLQGISSNDTAINAEKDLVIFYAPSNLWCTLSINGTLSCMATEGYPLGEVVCYQGGFLLKAVDKVREQDTLTATYAINSSNSASCCITSRSFPIPYGQCTEYVYYPTTGQPVMATDDLHTAYNSTDKHDNTTDYVYPRHGGYDSHKSIALVCVLLIITIVVYPLALLYHFKWQDRKSTRMPIDHKPTGDFHRL